MIFCSGLILSCSENSDYNPILDLKSAELGADKTHETKTVTVPFKAKFYTEPSDRLDSDPPRDCVDEGLPGDEDYIPFVNIQAGGGNATHLGEFTTRMIFCTDMQYNLDGGPWPYYNVVGTFVAANGDILNIKVKAGVVNAITDEEHPFFGIYTVEFNDEFYFDGGTGKFDGATGGGKINSLSNFIHTDHVWTGTLTLVKRKRNL
jgi:hypothetical protein